jgi:flagellar operon protein
MMTKIDINQVIQKTNLNKNQQQNIKTNRPQGQSFQDVLSKVKSSNQEVKLSKHAKARLDQRNITLSEADMQKINQAIEKAEKKGIKDALILMDNKAFVANIKNKTIITASTSEQLKENVFTNIDGAVIV